MQNQDETAQMIIKEFMRNQKQVLEVFYFKMLETVAKVLEENTPAYYHFGVGDNLPICTIWVMPKDQSPDERVQQLKTQIEERPKWVSVLERLPEKNGYYFVRGKRCGFYIDFDVETQSFNFPENVAHNHISDEYLEWLEL